MRLRANLQHIFTGARAGGESRDWNGEVSAGAQRRCYALLNKPGIMHYSARPSRSACNTRPAGRVAELGSRDDVFHHVAFHVGESEVAA